MEFDINRQNFENLVHYNATKLRLIHRGGDPFKILTHKERKRLIEEGIISRNNRFNLAFISVKAMDLLNEIYKNQL